MDVVGFLNEVRNINSSWTIAAFSIAAILAVLHSISSRRRHAPGSPVIWGIVIVICILGLMPILANLTLEMVKIRGAVYRVRVLVINPEKVPVSGATLTSTASSIGAVKTDQGVGEIAIPRATMPNGGNITIFADSDSQFLHGRSDILLADDLNRSLTIELKRSGDAIVSGLVEDSAGHAVVDATVSVLGGESVRTGSNGSFTVKTDAPVGQQVRLHVEKDGYLPIDQDHPAGPEPVSIIVARNRSVRPQRSK